MAKPSSNTRTSFWRRGAKVEVRTEEEGFHGAWFPATILEPPSNPSSVLGRKRKSFNSNKVLVQYNTFVTEKDPTKPLTEYTNVMFLRPSPPVEAPGKTFEAGEDVDAFHNDAWWPGVVMSVEGGDRYRVGFRDPPELLVLGRSELRSHLDWVNEIWSRPYKKRMKESMYSPGTPIEVRLVKEHLWSAWIPAIYSGALGGNLFLVQYRSLKNSDKDGIATVAVSDHQIRPRPPRHNETGFCLLDMVDAFHDMSWWVGSITNVLPDKKYIVTFKLTDEQKEFSRSELRLHMEWIDKKWESDFSRFGSAMDDIEQTQHTFTNSRNSAVATLLKRSPATKDSTGEENPYASSQKNQMKQLGPCIDKSAYRKTTNELKRLDQPNDDATFLSPTPSKKLKRHPEESVSIDEVYVRRTPIKISNEKGPVGDGVKTGSLLGEPGRQRKSQFDGSSPPLKIHVKKGSRMDKADEECIGDEHVMDKTESSGIQSDSEVTRRSLAGNYSLLHLKEINQHDEDGVSNQTKVKDSEDSTRNGTTEASGMEVQVTVPGLSAKPAAHDQPVSLCTDEMPSEYTIECSVNPVDEMHSQCTLNQDGKMFHEGTMECAGNPAATTNQQIPVAEAGLPGKTPTHDQPLPLCMYKMHSEKSMEGSSELKTLILVDYFGSEDPTEDGKAQATAMEVEVAGTEISSEAPLPDQPLLLCDMDSENTLEGNPAGTARTTLHDQFQASSIAEMYSEHTTEGSCKRAGTAKLTGRQGEAGITSEIEQEDTPHLPFVKKSPFWKMLESMDAFRRFPQQPHFKPLLKVKMLCREGLALGGMHIFAAVVEYTLKLQVDDPSDSINDILEALVELERLGFDVKALQVRLNELQDMKLRFAELKNKSDGVKILITNCTHERNKGSEVISGMDAEINDLEEKIREIQSKRAKAVSERAAKDSEISMLESEANAINEGIQSIEHDFQNLAAAAW
ncbi:DUF724 domain-containing protein 7 isoform X2 [Rosa chinensis]|uniref:DUF724 domain-containing protein 7 isoform X2 n=1 Tax=Rosa chinensis TaxID=74649 RepID=UPI001AD8BDA7|nr:DUF724 domain-containing protein 7 isoform X2 [Rosa chinensis]